MVVARCGLDAVATARQGLALARAGDERALLVVAWLAEVAGERGCWPTFVHPRLGTGCGGSGDDPAVAAAVVSLVRALALRVEGRTVALLPVVPTSWFGRPVDVRGVPTPLGRCSYSVRWHGERPALLWEIERAGGEEPIAVTCPGLDPTFRRDAPSGEALLAAPAPAPASSEPAAAEPGASFS
jgi:hypothetical protein